MGLRRNKKLKTCEAVRVAGSRPQGPVGQVSRGLGAQPPGLGAGPARRKEEGFHPLHLRQPSNTPPKVGG